MDELPVMREVFIAETTERAEELAAPAVTYLFRELYGKKSAEGERELRDDSGQVVAAQEQVDFEHFKARYVIGDPDFAIAEIAKLRDELGATDVICWMHLPGIDGETAMRSVELFAREVMPAFGGGRLMLFSKVLVANRGEIALRIVRTLRELGIPSVAVYSEADAEAPHVRLADEAVCIGAGPVAKSYLNAEAILEVARATGAEAVHPGYGFFAEHAGFARACAHAGLVFIGPPPEAIEAMGVKTTARRLMEEAGVPVVPGSMTPLTSAEDALATARGIGFPVAFKTAGGGGGKGFHVARSEDEAVAAFEQAANEGERFFANADVYVEEYLEDPRHVEVQILADAHGNVVHLGERDCSIQRRHQKLVEESPGPSVTPALRERICAIADRGRARRRLPRSRHRRGAARGRALLLPRDEHAPPGRAPGDRDGDRDRHRARADPRRRGRAALVPAGGRRLPRPRHRVPRQRRVGAPRLRPAAGHDHALRGAGRPGRARRLGRLRGLGRAAVLRLAAGQAGRLGRDARGRDAPDAARARRVPHRGHHDARAVPPRAARERRVGARRDRRQPARRPGLARQDGSLQSFV